MLRDVAVPVLPDLSPFELGVLCEVFGIDRTDQGVPKFDFAICAEHPGVPMPTRTGFSISADHGFDRLASADLIAVPAIDSGPYPEALLQALRDAVARGARVMLRPTSPSPPSATTRTPSSASGGGVVSSGWG